MGVTDEAKPRVDVLTMIGLALMIGPLTTMAHEIGGHAAMCLAVGGRVTHIGAFYVGCEAPDLVARRIEAMAGAGIDAVIFALGYLAWRAAKDVGDLARLALWLVFVVKGMVAAGYFLFSGATGVGDWGPGEAGGIGPLPNPMLIRAAEFVFGAAAYGAIVMLAMRTLHAMIGGGAAAKAAQRTIAHGFYLTNGAVALVVGLFNPLGFFIVVFSAMASSFGGTAGLISVGFARSKPPARAFHVGRSWAVMGLGVVVAGVFAAVLGPTVRL
jgi:hypothetical protein